MAVFSYAAACRLFGIAGVCWWEIDGSCARQGVDPLELDLDRFLNLVYSWFLERLRDAPKEDAEQAMQELFAPADGVDPDQVTQDVVDEEMALFHALARQNGTGG